MQQHNGMRPQDIIILLKFALDGTSTERLSDVSNSLSISASEISKSVQRSQYSGLINNSRKVSKEALLEFIIYGLPYVFPVKVGAPVRGIVTAISHPQIAATFKSNDTLVWPSSTGTARGNAITPLYAAFPEVAMLNPDLYFAAALVDVLRIGKTRERKFAQEELNKLLKR